VECPKAMFHFNLFRCLLISQSHLFLEGPLRKLIYILDPGFIVAVGGVLKMNADSCGGRSLNIICSEATEIE
jgi:hypothetical protein